MITWEGGEEPIRLMLKEGMRHKWRLVFGFVLICSAGVALGLMWPKTYASSVTISLEQDNIIDTLMDGRAVRTDVGGPPENASDMALGRSLLARALEESGQIDEDMSAKQRDELISDLGERTGITQSGGNLVTIHYRGPGPDGAQKMTERLGQLFIEETLKGRKRESHAAFEFIDRQVQRYQANLEEIEQQIEEVRAENPVAEVGAAERLEERETTLAQQVGELEQQIKEARIREQSVQDRLAEAPAGGSGEAATPQGPGQLAQLRSELATLRMNYTERHPDVIRVKRQIADLEEQQGQTGASQQAQGGSPGASGDDGTAPAGAASGDVLASAGGSDAGGPESQAGESQALGAIGAPMVEQLQGDLYNSRTQIRTLQSRLESVQNELASVRESQDELKGVQGQIAELQRDHEVNRNIYEDLLSRRENARVSRDLGSAQQGLTMRVEEPAQMPTTAEIPRPLHFAVAGGVLGAGVPIGLLFLVVMFDPRIRDVAHVPVETGSVLLTTIPHARTRVERRVAPLGTFACVLVVIATIVTLAALMWMQTSYGL